MQYSAAIGQRRGLSKEQQDVHALSCASRKRGDMRGWGGGGDQRHQIKVEGEVGGMGGGWGAHDTDVDLMPKQNAPEERIQRKQEESRVQKPDRGTGMGALAMQVELTQLGFCSIKAIVGPIDDVLTDEMRYNNDLKFKFTIFSRTTTAASGQWSRVVSLTTPQGTSCFDCSCASRTGRGFTQEARLAAAPKSRQGLRSKGHSNLRPFLLFGAAASVTS